MPRDVSTRWNSTYDMLQFATDYRAALDIMTADRDMNLRKYELSEKEWGMATELVEVLQVGFTYFFLCFFLIYSLFIRSSSTALFFFHAMHPTSALLSQPWTTLTNTWQRLVGTSSFPRPSVLRLLSERKLLIATTTKRTTRMFIGL